MDNTYFEDSSILNNFLKHHLQYQKAQTNDAKSQLKKLQSLYCSLVQEKESVEIKANDAKSQLKKLQSLYCSLVQEKESVEIKAKATGEQVEGLRVQVKGLRIQVKELQSLLHSLTKTKPSL
jgi:chromosome segregation ATPase